MAKMTTLSKQMTCFAGKDPRSKHLVESPMYEIVVHSAFRFPYFLYRDDWNGSNHSLHSPVCFFETQTREYGSLTQGSGTGASSDTASFSGYVGQHLSFHRSSIGLFCYDTELIC